MTEYDVLRKMMEIKQELLLIIKSGKSKYFEEEINSLYIEYLKLYVQVSERIPKYNSLDLKFKGTRHNCYFYALDFAIPQVFDDAMSSIGYNRLENSVGIISSGMPIWEINRTNLLDKFYADMDTLNIKVYNSDKYSCNIHDGYKVGIYIDDNSISNDYHFVRENSNGNFSHKCGYFSRPELLTCLRDIIRTDYYYELIKTVELVKPTIKR